MSKIKLTFTQTITCSIEIEGDELTVADLTHYDRESLAEQGCEAIVNGDYGFTARLENGTTVTAKKLEEECLGWDSDDHYFSA